MARLGLLILHGMGETKRGYSNELEEDIFEKLGDDLSSRLLLEEVYYQDILQDNQRAYFNKVKGRLRWDSLRRFMLYGFSDAASLETRKETEDSPYFKAQSIILSSFKNLYDRLEGEDRRVIILAQSLGGQVISNYLWDANLADGAKARHGVWSVDQTFDSPEQEAFCRGKNTLRLLTTGCNIPIFVAGFDRDEIKPIPKLNPSFQWHNYYDKDDVLGWPLGSLSDAYEERIHRDHTLNAGFLSGFTPLSHSHYWSDRKFLKALIIHIKRCL